MWVGGIRMSTIATSGSVLADSREELRGVAGLGDDLEAGLGEQPGDPLAQEDASRRRGRSAGVIAVGISARIAAPDSSSFGMNPRTRLAARRGP